MSQLRRGTRLGKYRLERRLGEGASAQVWLGRDTVQGIKVAIKVVSPATVEAYGRAAIEHEARVAARLDHPNIANVRNADWAGEFFILVIEPATRSLEDYSAARRSPALALSIIRDVAAGLAYAHRHKVLHRDVKPANILIYPGRVAKLGDFGTARFAPAVTRYQTDVGTQGYMAPEHAYGRARYASDVFSLGLTAYEQLTGTLPTWPFKWPFESHRAFEQKVPEPVQPVLRKALALDYQQRWPDAVAFHTALEQAIERTQSAPKPRKRSQKRRTPSPFEVETRWFKRKYGAALDLRFSCHDCEGPVAESMAVCPWCGTDRNAFGEVTSFPLICPDCERGVRPEWDACPWCYPVRFEGNGKKPPRDPRAERICGRKGCEGQLRPFMRYCPLCKTKVQRPWKVEDMRACTRCRWPTTDRWRFCPWCGRRQSEHLRI